MKILNRRFSREYEKIEAYEAGIVLNGAEVKSVRAGGLRLDGAYVKLIQGEPFLINAEIPKYRFAKLENYDPKRSRKLLLSKKELLKIKTKLKSSGGLTIVPVSCYNKDGFLKLEVALARGLRDHKKRRLEKLQTVARSQKREAKEYIKS